MFRATRGSDYNTEPGRKMKIRVCMKVGSLLGVKELRHRSRTVNLLSYIFYAV